MAIPIRSPVKPPGPAPTAIRPTPSQPVPASASSPLDEHEQPRRVVAARRPLRIVARLEDAVVVEQQPRDRRRRRRVHAEDDHAPCTSIAPPVAARVGQRDVPRDAAARQLRDRLGALRPLDERDRVRPEVRVEQARVLVGEAGEPVEVEVCERAGRAVVEDARPRRSGS